MMVRARLRALPPAVSLAALALLASSAPAQLQQQQQQRARTDTAKKAAAKPAPDPLRFQMMGPAFGGRVSAIVGVPGDARTWYLGNASGGVWKSSDSGVTFRPVFEKQPVQAIGALAVAESRPTTVWAGTGEAWAIRDADVMGDGVYKSTDSGATWTNVGLRETGRIGRIVVHPTNPSVVYVCALGRATGPQEERGVYRTTDGGATWKRVLFVDANTGCSGLTLDARHPNVLFAGMWQVEMHTWAMFSGGPSSAIYVSRDGGSTWSKVAHPGLPKSPVGKIDVAVAPSDSRRVYALIQTADQGALWRSDDGGRAWRAVNWNRALIGRAGYYIRLAVSPRNADEVLVANSSFYRSTDGGRQFVERPWGGDNHDIWYDPKNADRIGLTNDLGARLTTTHGKSWSNVVLPNGQMYHVAVDARVPYWIYSNRQDNGTMRGPSTVPEALTGAAGEAKAARAREDSLAKADSAALHQLRTRRDSATLTTRDTALAAVARRDSAQRDSVEGGQGVAGGGGAGGSTWDHGLGGCESGFTIPDPTDHDVVWATCYGNQVTRWNGKTKIARSVSPWRHTLDSPPNVLKYRCHWTPPLAIDPFDHETVYYGCQVIFRTKNAGQSWAVISPDLSTRDSSRIVPSGGIVGDNLGQFYGEVVFAIAPSEIQRGLIWAGTNDGQLWNTRDGGATWTNVTKNVSGMPAWGTIRKIEPSRFDSATAYVAVDVHMMDDRKPYVFKTTDYGRTWSNVTGDLPASHPLDYVMAVAENPNRRGMLFAGTGHAFYYSLDDGAHWKPYAEGLPAAPVTWIVVPKVWHDVVVSTYGRGLFILKDVTALEQIDQRPPPVTAAASSGDGAPSSASSAPTRSVRLFPPRPGYRMARSGRAEITFSLDSATKDVAKVEILDTAGAVVRTIKARTRAGYNRVGWDVRHDPAKKPELRTVAPDNPRVWEEARFLGKTTRPITHWGIQPPQNNGPLALPGRYTVRLTAAGRTLTQPIEILKNDELTTPDADLAASSRAQLRIRDDLNSAVEMLNRLEVMRRQIEVQRTRSAGKPDVLSALAAMDAKMLDVEMRLVSRSDLNSDDKYFAEPYRIYMNLIWLAGEVGSGAGDVAGGGDARPTDASLAVLDEIEHDLAAAKAAYGRLMKEDVPDFNRTMAGRVEAIVAGQ